MFNLKTQKSISDIELLRIEMKAFDIVKNADGYAVKIGDKTNIVPNIKKVLNILDQGILELKEHSYYSWQDINHIIIKIFNQHGQNSGSLDNLIFLNSVKRCCALSHFFPKLINITRNLLHLKDIDIKHIDNDLVKHFNSEFIRVHCLHHLIMNELYRKKLVYRFMNLTKQSQISGPWANLDLPMQERVWEWNEGEKAYFDNRQKSRRQQIRYNPENATAGFYYVWNDFLREPYEFDEKDEKSPYKSRLSISVP